MKLKPSIDIIPKICLILILIISMMFFANKCNAQLTTSSNVELRYDKFSTYVSYQFFEIKDYAIYESPWLIVGTLDFGLHYKGFSFINKVESYFNSFSMDTGTFDIYFVNYLTVFNYKIKDFEIGYKHNCFHPVFSPNGMDVYSNYSDSFYVKFKIK